MTFQLTKIKISNAPGKDEIHLLMSRIETIRKIKLTIGFYPQHYSSGEKINSAQFYFLFSKHKLLWLYGFYQLMGEWYTLPAA